MFKPGQTVRCVRASDASLTKGKDYFVSMVIRGRVQVKSDDGYVQRYAMRRFRKVREDGTLGPRIKKQKVPVITKTIRVNLTMRNRGPWHE